MLSSMVLGFQFDLQLVDLGICSVSHRTATLTTSYVGHAAGLEGEGGI